MNKITYAERKAVYEQAIAEYGPMNQIIKAIEEMAELTKELCKLSVNDPKYSVEGIAEEIADVTIMLEQLRLIFHINAEVCAVMDAKVKRLEGRLKSREE